MQSNYYLRAIKHGLPEIHQCKPIYQCFFPFKRYLFSEFPITQPWYPGMVPLTGVLLRAGKLMGKSSTCFPSAFCLAFSQGGIGFKCARVKWKQDGNGRFNLTNYIYIYYNMCVCCIYIYIIYIQFQLQPHHSHKWPHRKQWSGM